MLNKNINEVANGIFITIYWIQQTNKKNSMVKDPIVRIYSVIRVLFFTFFSGITLKYDKNVIHLQPKTNYSVCNYNLSFTDYYD